MNAKQYQAITEKTRSLVKRLPLQEKLLSLPTYLCAVIYLVTLGQLAWVREPKLIRVILVPAACFLFVTFLRPMINRQRPYDRFNLPPVGKWEKGKGKSFPSRHAVSAAAIAVAVMYAYPTLPVCVGMTLLGMLIAFLRIAGGQHYSSDVVAAILLSAVFSAVGYGI